MADGENPSVGEPRFLEDLCCSFCGKRGDEVERLIAGRTPDLAICNECVELCSEILTEAVQPDASDPDLTDRRNPGR